MIANKEKCADKDKSVCDYNEYRRLRYFHGMLLDDKDFKAEQDYHTRKRRFLNRMLHGWGVVCGLELKGKKGERAIEVTSGFALDCSGNEIWVPHGKAIDLASLLPAKDKGNREGECIEEEPGKPNTYYIGVRYEEKPSDPVSVYMPSGSCEERTCENSRFKEGYCIELVTCSEKTDPDTYPGLIKGLCGCTPDFEKPEEKDLPACSDYSATGPKELCQQLIMEQFCEQSVPCPECCSCEKPCFVVLGKIEVNKDCRLESICLNNCRRYVLTFRLLQHMLQAIFAGALGENGYFKMQDQNNNKISLPDDANEWVYNPIKALCWWLPYKFAGGEFSWLGCDKKEGRPEEKLQVQFAQAQVKLDQLTTKVNALMMKDTATATPPLAVTDATVADTVAKDQQAKTQTPARGKKGETQTPTDQT